MRGSKNEKAFSLPVFTLKVSEVYIRLLIKIDVYPIYWPVQPACSQYYRIYAYIIIIILNKQTTMGEIERRQVKESIAKATAINKENAYQVDTTHTTTNITATAKKKKNIET